MSTFRKFIFAGCFAAAVLGLQKARTSAGDESARAARADKASETQAANKAAPHKIRGHCFDVVTNSPAVGVRVLLFAVQGRTPPIAQVSETVSDAKGDFEFANLAPPQDLEGLDQLKYEVFAIDPNRAIGMGFVGFPPGQPMLVCLNEQGSLTGKVVNSHGQPVAGAVVGSFPADGRVIPGILSATTGPDGRFTIDKLPLIRTRDGRQLGASVQVLHRNYAPTSSRVAELPADVTVSLPDGCTVTGRVVDGVTGKPAANALVTSQRVKFRGWQETFASTDAAGNFRMVLPEGRYYFLAEGPDRVSVALVDRECLAGQTLDLPPITLIAGGLISGRVINTSTHRPVPTSGGNPIVLGLYGPSHPPTPGMTSPARLTSVDAQGRFTLRAAPGKNFPYFVNERGDRMAWHTQEQPPIIVKEGETTAYDMLITPPVPPGDKLKAAAALIASLPQPPAARTARILAEFDKQKRLSEDTERWCSLMRELVTIGPSAVPLLCEELDRTDQPRVVTRLAFALRAIGDPRAVPALIRAIPKTLDANSGDSGLIVQDLKLRAFMQQHHLGGQKGLYFHYSRPVRELFGGLHKMTGQDFADSEINRIQLSEDPRRQVLQRRLFLRQARRWQAWWEANWQKFTRDPAYEKVRLASVDEILPPSASTLGKTAHVSDRDAVIGEVLSPASEGGRFATYFIDLDTGYQPKWPSQFPRDESRLDPQKLAKWALENGVDLMCVTQRAADGTETYVLKAFHMRVWEIGPRDVRNLDRSLAAGKLPAGRAVAGQQAPGREVGELLMHYDAESGRLIPEADAAFLYETSEGSRGLIEITDRITRTEDLRGPVSASWPKAVGFHRGVKFNLKSIIP